LSALTLVHRMSASCFSARARTERLRGSPTEQHPARECRVLADRHVFSRQLPLYIVLLVNSLHYSCVPRGLRFVGSGCSWARFLGSWDGLLSCLASACARQALVLLACLLHGLVYVCGVCSVKALHACDMAAPSIRAPSLGGVPAFGRLPLARVPRLILFARLLFTTRPRTAHRSHRRATSSEGLRASCLASRGVIGTERCVERRCRVSARTGAAVACICAHGTVPSSSAARRHTWRALFFIFFQGAIVSTGEHDNRAGAVWNTGRNGDGRGWRRRAFKG